MAPTVDRPEPPYLQIVDHLRQQIRSGQLRDGDLVPSVRQLARDWQVSPPTAQKALAKLQAEGYVRGVHGTGTVVSASRAMSYAGRDRLHAVRTGRIYPPNERAEIRSAELVTAPDAIAEALGLAAGSQVVRRHRVTYRDGDPISASTTWMPGRFARDAPRLLSTERIIEGTAGYVAEITGQVVVRGLDQGSARAATDQDAADLGVLPGSPVACGRNWWYDAEGNVIEYGEYASVPGRWSSHQYELTT